MTADKLRILGDLWASNAFGDVTEWRKLGGAELRAECARLQAHWVSLGWSVGTFNAQDMLEYLQRQWQPRTFLIGDEHVSDTTVQADSLEDALELARDWARDGSWDHRCEVDVFAVELDPLADDGRDRRGAEVGDRTWTTVEVGEDAPEPECEEADEHDWRSPHSVLSGLKENPGVWSEGGTKMVFRKVCKHCGCYRTETSVGAQRNPGELDRIEYDRPDEVSLRWVSKCLKE
jgi:hypothetical protein